MKPSLNDLEVLINECNGNKDGIFHTAHWLAVAELNRRGKAGRPVKYTGDAAERNRQSVAAFRDRKKMEEEMNRDRLKKSERAKRRLEARQQTIDDEPIRWKPKKRKY